MKHYRYNGLLRSALLTTILCVYACSKDHFFDFTKSTGPIVTENRYCTSFNRLHLDDDVDIILHTDTTPFLKVTAGQNLITGIITDISDNTLFVRNENRSNWVRSFKNRYTVEVGMQQPEMISYFGSGTLTCADTIRYHDFTFDCWNGSGSINLLLNCNTAHISIHNGRCDITACGKSGVTYLFQNDTGVLFTDALSSGYCYVRNSGTGDIYLNVEKELGAEINYFGNIYYRGNPYRIDKTGSGNGKLIRE